MFFKIIYFMFNSHIAAFFPFFPLYLERAGIPGTQIGLLLAVFPVVNILIAPLWGMLADYKNWHGRIVMLTAVGGALVIPAYVITSTFWSFLLLQILFCSLVSPIEPFINKLAIEVQRIRDIDFGRVRLYGSLGFALTVLIGGRVFQEYGIYLGFLVASGFLIILSFSSRKLPQTTDISSENIFSDVKEVFTIKPILIFLLSITLIRTASMSLDTYISIIIEHMGSGESVTGLSWALPAFIEIPIFFFSAKFLGKYGLKKVIFCGFLLTIVQVILFNLAFSTVLVVIAQMFRGFGFALLFIAGINFLEKMSPPKVKTTCQTLFITSLFGLSSLFGSLIGGFLYENFSLTALYRFSLVVVLSGTFLFYYYFFQRKAY